MFFFNIKSLNQLINSRRNNFIALFLAIALHSSILLSQGYKSESLINQKQTLKISLVAKSSLASNNENSYHQNFLQKDKLNSADKKFAKKSTSGKTAENATATNSADIAPIFDAQQLNNPAPKYPEIARQRGIEGEVLLKVKVSISGKPLSIDIVRSSGSSILDICAIDTLKTWQFLPAKAKDKFVEASVMVPIVFKII